MTSDTDRLLGHLQKQCDQRARRLARGLAWHPEEADELVHEAYLVAARKPNAVPLAAPWPWFANVILGLARNRRRRHAREKERTAVDVELDELADPAADFDPLRAAQVAELVERLADAFAQLPEAQRAALILRRIDGYSAKEAAAKLGIGSALVDKHVSRGTKRLRKLLGLDATAKGHQTLLHSFALLGGAGVSGAISTSAAVRTTSGNVIAKRGIVMAAIGNTKKFVAAGAAAVVLLLLAAGGWQLASWDGGRNSDDDPGSASPTATLPKERVASSAKETKPSNEDHAPAEPKASGRTRKSEPPTSEEANAEANDATAPRIVGRVVDESGAPVPAAKVDVLRTRRVDLYGRDERPSPQLGVTDETGRFEVQVREVIRRDMEIVVEPQAPLARTLFRVPFFTYSHEMFDEFMQSEDGRKHDVGELVVSQAASLVGRALDENGKPIAGATIVFEALRHASPRAVTDEDGTFRFDGVAPGTHEITAYAADHFTTEAEVELTAGERLKTEIVLRRSPRVEVHVHDAAGEPLEGADVHLYWDSTTRKTVDEFQSDVHDVTDEDGRVVFTDLRNTGRNTIVVERKGYKTRHTSFSGPEGVLISIDLTLPLAASVRVRPVDAESNEPLYSQDSEVSRFWFTSAPIRIGRATDIQMEQQRMTIRTDGTAILHSTVTGTHPVRVQHPRYMDWQGEITIQPGEEVDLGDISLERGVHYRFVVNDGEGNPIEGAEIVARPFGGMASMFEPSFTDEEGIAEVGRIGRARIWMTVSHPEFLSYSDSRDNVPSDEPEEIRVVLRRHPTVTGSVFDMDGEPLANISVGTKGQPGRFTHTQTDSQGQFVLDSIRPGRHRFIVRQRDERGWVIAESRDIWFTVSEGETLEQDIHLEPRAFPTLTGTLLYADGSVATHVALRYGGAPRSSDSSPREVVETDSQGRFEFWGPYRRLEPGRTFRMQVKVEPYSDLSLRFQIPDDAEPFDYDGGYDLGEVRLPEFDPESRATIRLHVIGNAVQAVPMSISIGNDTEVFSRRIELEGDATFDGLPLGTAWVTVDEPNLPHFRAAVEMEEPGAEKSIEIPNLPLATVTFRVNRLQDDSIAEAGIMVVTRFANQGHRGPSKAFRRNTQAASLTRFAIGLEYVATVRSRGYQSEEIRFTPTQPNETIEVTLQPE